MRRRDGARANGPLLHARLGRFSSAIVNACGNSSIGYCIFARGSAGRMSFSHWTE